MISDLTLEPDDDGRPPPDLGLVVPAPDPHLAISEWAYRMGDYPGGREIIFVEASDTGEEIFETAEKWMRLMNWPRLPTLAEAEQWQTYQRARLARAQWDQIQTARAERT